MARASRPVTVRSQVINADDRLTNCSRSARSVMNYYHSVRRLVAGAAPATAVAKWSDAVAR